MLSILLTRYKEAIEKNIADNLGSFGPKTALRDAIEYALKNGGKRFRPAIVYMVANALGKEANVDCAALAIEYFHTASLIADDLPCMDNDDQRRDIPSLHKAYGEATAILATYALIAEGYDAIRLGAQRVGRNEICAIAIENASLNTGILGAAGGQYQDLFPSILTEEAVLDIIDKKTGTLFEISFVFGWLYGGGELASLNRVKQAARSFGRAFQVSDDFLDLEQDRRGVNYPAVAGIEKAHSLLSQELENYYLFLRELKLESPELLALGHLIEKRVAAVIHTQVS